MIPGVWEPVIGPVTVDHGVESGRHKALANRVLFRYFWVRSRGGQAPDRISRHSGSVRAIFPEIYMMSMNLVVFR